MGIKYTLDSARKALKLKNQTYVTDVISVDHNSSTITLIDKDYGEYKTDLKSICPQSPLPLHKRRKHHEKMKKHKEHTVGKVINDCEILDVFYGPDRGYKNKGFYLEYRQKCGHIGIGPKATLVKHLKSFSCRACSTTTHGERGQIGGVLKKRTTTYIFWLKVKDRLPLEYQDFVIFKEKAGDKPYKYADIKLIENKIFWVDLQIDTDREVNLLASSIRQAFRHSDIYKRKIENARIETLEGPRYICNICKMPFKKIELQVDHIDPIMPLDGSPLMRDVLIERIWTNNIQILDKSCHVKKSTFENKQRKINKLALQKAKKS